MSEIVTVNIDGHECKAKEGEFILNVARANNIFVPALCYLTRCSPTLACRLCLVESDGKQVYACNAKVKDGMTITTNTPNIAKERRAIMEVYDVNHPLQCGVCDQSGECELQNYTLYMGVDKQNYAVRDVDRPTKKWGVMSYDPGLCIVCEKCVTVCKDMIGSSALSTTKRGADALDKQYKANMPKDAYAMWNKLNKNLIDFDESKCIDCGECISVCPVGSMVSTDFKYQSNAWELTKIPAANPYSSDCSLIYYEVKAKSIQEHDVKKIYRVTNDSHYTSISGAARFGFDYYNKAENKNSQDLATAVEKFKNANSVLFSSYITNEEALILQKLKEKIGFNLVNKDASDYKNFLANFATTSGHNLYNGTLKDIHNSNFIISVGSFFKSDAPSVRFAFNNAITINKGAGLYFHPLKDTTVEGFGKKGKTIETIFHNPSANEAILYFVLDQFGENLPENISSYLESLRETRVKTVTETIKEKVVETVTDEETGETKEVTKMVPKKVSKEVEYVYTTLLDTIGTDETLLETISDMLAKKDTFSLVVGEDLYKDPNSANLAKLCGLIEKYTQFKVVIIPSHTNTLGVSLICSLDDEVVGNTVGYNVKADYQISALGDGDLDMPSLNQQEGTFVNIDKRVVPTNVALPYGGYTLNDIANEILEDQKENTIDYTSELFKQVNFDDLPNEYTNGNVENRGYIIDITNCDSNDQVEPISGSNLEGEFIICDANPRNQFNEFTNASANLTKEPTAFYISSALAENLGVVQGDSVEITTQNDQIVIDVMIDNQLDGDIGYVSTFDKNRDTKKLFAGYRYTTANIKKV